MRFAVSSFAVLALGAVVVSANNGHPSKMPKISPECETAIVAIFSSPEAACLNPAGLAPFALADPDTSLVPTIDAYLTGFCALPACTDDALKTLATALVKGCPKEFAPLQITPEKFAEAVIAVFPTVKKGLCFVDTTDKKLCVTQTLTNIEGVVGPLTLKSIGPALEGYFTGDPVFGPNVYCTDCVKAVYTLFQAEFPDFFVPGTDKFFKHTCGPSFVDGKIPASISQSAHGSTSAKFKFRRWAIEFSSKRK